MKQRINRLLMPVLVWVLVSAGCVEAGVYRWVDENGKVHFSDRPGTAEDADEVQIKQKGESDQSAPHEADRAETRQRLLEQYQKERLQKKEATEKKKAEDKQRERNCAIAKNRLSTYERSALYELDSGGERRYLSEAEYEKALASARAEVRQWCD